MPWPRNWSWRLESFILVDDDPKECTEAQAGAPEVLALPLPARAEEIPAFLRHVWAFDRARVTEEDRQRPELYAAARERARAERAAASLEEFRRRCSSKSGSRPWSGARWRAWPSLPSAPTR